LWGVKVLGSDLRKAFTTEVTENTRKTSGLKIPVIVAG